MVYQGATGLYHVLIDVIPFISNSVLACYSIGLFKIGCLFEQKQLNSTVYIAYMQYIYAYMICCM